LLWVLAAKTHGAHPATERIGRFDHTPDIWRDGVPIWAVPCLVQTLHGLDTLEIAKLEDGQLSGEFERCDIGELELFAG
jgi:hypothetical protein